MDPTEISSALSRVEFERLSFAPQELAARLTAAEDWGKLVVCHIYLDHILTTALKEHMPKAESFLGSGHKTFADKLALCQALEIIDDEIVATLTSINRHRNKFAHRLVFDVPDQTKIDLFRQFSPSRPKDDVLSADGFANLLFTVAMLVECERISTRVIAEKTKEIAFYREQISKLAVEMFKDGKQ